MEKIRLGRTGLMVTKVSMGCIPIQRLSTADAVALLRQAYDLGVNFYDTAHVYTDSEEKIGRAFGDGLRAGVIIATKAKSATYEGVIAQLDESLRRLRTDYIDLYQWHNPTDLSDFQPETCEPYQAMLEAKRVGKVRFIGITNHSLERAHRAVDSGAFDTMQYPLSVLSSDAEIEMAYKCRERDMGVIAMKAMCGGLLPDGRLASAFFNQHPHIVPIWGVEKIEYLKEFIKLAAHPEPLTEAMRAETEKIRREYGDDFCRGCGYCLPCAAELDLPLLMRILYLIKRGAIGAQLTPERRREVQDIDNCTECGQCLERCPYHLTPPTALKKVQTEYLRQYEEYWAQKNG